MSVDPKIIADIAQRTAAHSAMEHAELLEHIARNFERSPLPLSVPEVLRIYAEAIRNSVQVVLPGRLVQ